MMRRPPITLGIGMVLILLVLAWGQHSRGGEVRMRLPAQRRTTVAELQKAQQTLKDTGLYAGPIDGVLGPETLQALREFQASQGLPQTGKLDEATRQQLMITSRPGGCPEGPPCPPQSR
jgi:murein L,D-transpeptidase YcbB/YkuD